MERRIWDPQTYDAARRRLVPCFEQFYGTAVELVARTVPTGARVLDLGAGTGLLSESVAERIRPSSLVLVDGSAEMLAMAQQRLQAWNPETRVQDLQASLPPGPFDAVVSALAIHHLEDRGKEELFGRILGVLAPGALFVNAEQVQGINPWEQQLFESTHLERARALGSSEEEIAQAVERMRHDQCSTVGAQLQSLRQLGYERADCFFQWFRFAVYAGWKKS